MSIRIDAPDTNPGSTTSGTQQNDAELVDGMRKEFKEAMDSYEAVVDEYIAFMKNTMRIRTILLCWSIIRSI